MLLKKNVFFIFLLSSLSAFSQEKIQVQLVDRPSSFGIEPAFEASIPEADLEKAEDLFNRSIAQRKFFGLIKKKIVNQKKGQEWVTQQFVLDKVTETPMVILFQISNFSTQTYIRFFFQTKDGFLGAKDVGSDREISNAKSFVYDYAAGLYRETLGDQIDKEKQAYSKLQKKYNKLERKNEKIRSHYMPDKPTTYKKKSGTDYVDVGKAVDREDKYLKREKKGQKMIRRNQKKQAKLKAQMKNQQTRLDKLQDKQDDIN